MPKLVPQCTAAPIPALAPDLWEENPVFRETCLLYVSEPGFNEALRVAASHFFAMLLECCGEWPAWPESSTRTELRAAAADLRHLQGFLASVGREREVSSLSPSDAQLSRFASGIARALERLAGSIEDRLDPHLPGPPLPTPPSHPHRERRETGRSKI